MARDELNGIDIARLGRIYDAAGDDVPESLDTVEELLRREKQERRAYESKPPRDPPPADDTPPPTDESDAAGDSSPAAPWKGGDEGPLRMANDFIARFYRHPDGITLHKWRGDFYRWSPELASHVQLTDDELDGEIYRRVRLKRPSQVRDVRAALVGVDDVVIDHAELGSWIGRPTVNHPPLDLAPCRNGLLHLPTSVLLPATPRFFTTAPLGVGFDPGAPKAKQCGRRAFTAAFELASPAVFCAMRRHGRRRIGRMPTGQITRNCHYISRSLTRPWEAGQRRLHFYDFDAGGWDHDSSYALFAEDSLNPQHVESWLDRTIEGPLSQCRRRLASGVTGALEEWGFYRAATLMLWLQGMRVKSVSDHDARRNVEQLATRSIEETDQLVLAIREEYDLVLVTTVGRDGMFAPLFFPSSGLFPLTYPDTGYLSGYAVALGLPLDLWSALVASPRENDGVRDVSRIPASLSNLSVGIANARKVVVPPLLIEQRPQAEVARILRDQREANAYLMQLVKDSKRLVADAFEETGLQPPRDR